MDPLKAFVADLKASVYSQPAMRELKKKYGADYTKNLFTVLCTAKEPIEKCKEVADTLKDMQASRNKKDSSKGEPQTRAKRARTAAA